MTERDRKTMVKSDQTPSALEAAAGGEEGGGGGILMGMREWLDALIIAFVLAMFIRTFVVELFKIPSGSMTPTLLGDFVAEGIAVDSRGQSNQYLLVRDRTADSAQVFRRNGRGHYQYEGRQWLGALTASQRELLERDLHLEEHRIFVNKFAYWFRKPARGDIIIFRVPFDRRPRVYERDGHTFRVSAFNRAQAVYVKRAVAFDGELVEIGPGGRLVVNGEEVTEPPIFQELRYTLQPPGTREFSVRVPPGTLYAFGDNSDNSQDSRWWDGVPYENLRGKAFFRYWPARKMSFLK
ncbi:MAG: signal peptidase I [Candidatus Sumerlaeaceae bacterium]|nr:signal peptidase I [Candidatus Sumerlaeaceae bacterium]